ncbi:unnamed protein product [Ilex paraguariensis]|uniref:Peptidase S9A N-terminal domain-containing protein n=1 Tax=Ilex paraguariensis TaxID=185542 RepID=A0ABC8RDU2_9AQUA
MAALAILSITRKSIKRTHLSSILRLSPTISSSPFSSPSKNHQPFSTLSKTQSPPVPKKVPFTVSAHGMTWQDPYHWMSNINDPDFIDYIKQENLYAEAFMDDTQKVQQTLYSEMISKMPFKISTPPERWGPWSYYQYIPDGKEYPVLCRKLAAKRKGWVHAIVNYVRGGFGREEVLLDWNEIAERYGYVHVGTCRVSPDHNYLAYTVDTTGGEQFTLQIKDLRSGCALPKLGVGRVVSLAWAQDSCTLFYTMSDENQRPYRVLCTKLGSDSVADVPIYTENDSSFHVDITSTKDGKFITVYVIKATNPQQGLQRVCKRVSGVQCFLEHHNGFFYILTNASLSEDKDLPDSGNFYLARCRVDDMQATNLQNVLMPSKDIIVQDMDIFNEHLVLSLNKKGSPVICSIKMPIDANCENQVTIEDLNPWFFPLPSNLCSIVPGSNHDFMTSVFRAVISSPVNQVTIEDLNPWFFPLPSNLCSIVPGSNHDFMTSVFRAVISSPVETAAIFTAKFTTIAESTMILDSYD